MAIHNPVTSYGVNSSGDSAAQTVTGGAAHVRPYGAAAAVSIRRWTIDGAGDVFTNKAAPVNPDEILYASFDGTKQHLRVTYHVQNADVAPWASAVVISVNDANIADGTASLTWTDKGAGDTSASDAENPSRMVSSAEPVIEYDFGGTETYITSVYGGGYPPAAAGTGVVYVTLEVW